MSNIIEKIATGLANMKAFVIKTFGWMDAETKILVPLCIHVVNAIKQVVDSPLEDGALKMILKLALGSFISPAEIDQANTLVQKWVPVVLAKLSEIQADASLTIDAQVDFYVSQIRLLTPDAQAVKWTGLSATLVKDVADGVSIGDAINAVVQTYQSGSVA
jgi:hypothetical protein